MENQGLLYLSDADVAASGVGMSRVIEALESMFVEKGEGRVEMPPKPGIHTRPNALIHAMPAYLPATGAAGMKWVSAYPENHSLGLPQISGLIVLNDEETGIPFCIMDCRRVTAWRTGAKTAVAARYLARPDSSTVGVLGCGIQGRSNIEALACRFDIEEVRAYDVFPESAARYAEDIHQRLGLNVRVVQSPEAAVRDMDIVVTAGPILRNPTPVIEDAWLKPGAFAAPVDFDSYWKGDVLRSVDLFVTDDVDQFFFYQKMGYFREAPPRERVTDLGSLAAGLAQGRGKDDTAMRTLAMNLGLALDDMATAPLVYQAAREKGLGVRLER